MQELSPKDVERCLDSLDDGLVLDTGSKNPVRAGIVEYQLQALRQLRKERDELRRQLAPEGSFW